MIFAEFWRDPGMPYVESRRACHSRACYKPHSHPTYSIGSVDSGRSVFTSVDHAPVTLRPGTVVFVPPARVHACNPSSECAWSYQMLHIDAQWLETLRSESSDIGGCHGAIEPVRIVQDDHTYRRFSALNAKLFSEDSVCEKEAVLIEFIGDCSYGSQVALSPPVSMPKHDEKLEKVLDFLHVEHTTVPTLAELAGLAGVSRYQLIRLFRAATGMTPHAWHLNHRINQARRYLCRGMPLAEVAYRLGFADQSHFQRIFKAHVGATPGDYRSF